MTDKNCTVPAGAACWRACAAASGEYFGIDPTLVRLMWAASAVVFGTGVLAYILAAIIIPREPAL